MARDFIDFVKAWANVAYGDEVVFDTMSKIVKGDVTELKVLVGCLLATRLDYL